MKVKKFLLMAVAVAMVCVLGACNSGSIKLEMLEEADGVKVTADHANKDNVATCESALTVADGDVIVISPCLDKGSFHLVITEHDAGTVLYDEDVDGRIMFPIEAAPGEYNVEVSGNKATGWMTVFAKSSEELEAEDAALDEVLEQEGVEVEELTDNKD
jgi:hypothetical protein